MICQFCGKVSEQKLAKWINYEIGEEYNICRVCVEKIKSGNFKE